MCDYCKAPAGRSLGHSSQKINPFYAAYANHFIQMKRGKAELVLELVDCGEPFEIKTPINYCPMCGRKIRKE